MSKFKTAPNGIPIHHIGPELKIPKHTSKDQRWYIQFYVWDADKNKHIRIKDYDINRAADKEKFAKTRIAELSYELNSGSHIDKVKIAEEKQQSELQYKLIQSLISSLNEFVRSKAKYRPKTHKNYQYHIGKFTQWLMDTGKSRVGCHELTQDMANSFFAYISDEGYSRRSYNNFKSYLTTAWYDLQKAGHFKEQSKNPFSNIVKLKTGMGKNIAYQPGQQKELLAFMRDRYPDLRNVCLFMYYTLLRTNEISQLQIFEVDTYKKGYIYLPKEKSKNIHERWVKISDDLREILNGMDLDKYPKNYYLFSKGFKPGAEWYNTRKFGDLYSKFVLIPLNYSLDTYSLYCWKHTGVVSAKRAGVTDADIMLQAGWQDISSYNTYLKSLGLYAETKFVDGVPSILHL